MWHEAETMILVIDEPDNNLFSFSINQLAYKTSPEPMLTCLNILYRPTHTPTRKDI